MEAEPCLQGRPMKVTVSKDYGKRSNRIRMEGPDGGWAWFVALAACLINFIMAGLGRMSGILYVAFIDIFHADRERAAFPFSIRSATRNLLGPVVGILGQKYGVRVVTITGGIIGTLSAASCFYAQDIVWITIIWGGINGVGTALTTTLPQVVIGQYFIKHKTTASGMAFSGGCVGSFLFPALLEWLLFEYGLQGTFLIIGAIIMHVIPAAMILKTPPWLKDNKIIEKPTKHLNLEKDAAPSNYNSSNTQDGPFHVNGKTILTNGEVISTRGKEFDVILKKGSENFKIDIDYSYLRRNKELVLKLLTLEISPEDIVAKVPEEQNKSIFRPVEEKYLLEDMENLYRNLERSQNKNKILLDLTQFKNGAFLNNMEDECDVEKSPYKKSQSFDLTVNSSKINNSENSSMYKIHSVPEFNMPKEFSQNNIFIKLQELQGYNDDQILSFFLTESHSEVLKLTTELRKICILCTQMGHLKPNGENSAHSLLINGNPDGVHTSIERRCTDQQSNTFWIHIKTAFKLHSNPIFLLVCLCRAVHFITFIPVVTSIVDYAMDKGLQETDGKYVIAALSLGDLVGRLGLGWITDRDYISLTKYMLLVMVIQGASTASLPLMHAKSTLLPAIALFGMLQGSVFVRHPVLISKYMGKNEQSIAMGCINFFSGFLGFGIPSYIGYFRDTIGSYDNIFYINGAIGAFIGLLWSFEPYFVRHFPPKVDVDGFIESV